MFRWLAILALVGCGRVGFDPLEPPFDLSAGECPPDYSLLGASCYRVVLVELVWIAAEQDCEADAYGAHLAVIDDEAERAAVHALFPTTIDDFNLGLSDRISEGTFQTVTGRPPYLFWAPQEPDGNQDCGKLSMGQLKDSDCLEDEEYACEYDALPANPAMY